MTKQKVEMDKIAAARIQSSMAKANNGKTSTNSFSSRAQSTADRRAHNSSPK